jgi:putative transcriptional regulator
MNAVAPVLPNAHLPTHHPPEELLAGHAAGTLPEAVALVVATHLGYCPQCRQAMGDFEALGGALLEEMVPAALDQGSLERVLARLDAPESRPLRPAAPARPITDPLLAGLPAPLRRALGDAPRIRWRPVVPGVVSDRVLPRTTPGYHSRLIKVRPGKRAPEHRHTGEEYLLVLDGITHQDGFALRPGDLRIADPSVVHDTLSDPQVGCTCLILLTGPIRLGGLLGALVNPLRIY